MGRLDDLRRTLPAMAAQAQAGAECLLVDYSCPELCGDWAEANVPGVRVLRVAGRPEFHRSEAKNLGARASGADWLAFIDADVLLATGFVAELAPRLGPGTFLRADSPDGGLGGTFLCDRGDFDRAGGFDEAYRGWGEEDNDLYDAFRDLGLREQTFPEALARHLPHGDDRRVRFHATADTRLSHAINRVYRLAKRDLSGVRRGPLPADLRAELYARVARKVAASFGDGTPAELVIELDRGLVPGDWSLGRSLVYRLAPDP
jgi:hypothetical protein